MCHVGRDRTFEYDLERQLMCMACIHLGQTISPNHALFLVASPLRQTAFSHKEGGNKDWDTRLDES